MGVVWLGCSGGGGSAGGGDVAGVLPARWYSQSEDRVLESEDEGGRDETVLEGEPVKGVNDTGRSVVAVEANRPSVFLGRLTFLLSARTVG
jgi:hypothetical protein